MLSPRPICMSCADIISGVPPSWLIPTSKDTRVRVDGFSKIIATDFPASGFGPSRPAFSADFISAA